MQIVDSDLKAPGACIVCLKSRTARDGGSMVDTGQQNDYGIINERAGQIYVCDVCVGEMAEAYGFVPAPVDDGSEDATAVALSHAQVALDDIQDIINKARPRAAQEA